MTLAAILCQAGTIGGTLATAGYNAISVAPTGYTHVNTYVEFNARVPVFRWDGEPASSEDIRVGTPIRVQVVKDEFSPYELTATRVILGPPPPTPPEAESEAFAAVVEQWVAGTCTSPREGLDDETAEAIEALGSPSHAARERATGELRGWPRERLAKALAWALGVRWPRRTGAEIRHRAAGIARARWIETGEAP